MKTKHLLTSIHMEFHLNMGDSTESLYLSTNLEDTDYTQIRLYNPDNLFVGEITHSRFDYKTNLFIDSNRSTINALKHSLVKGEYTLVVDTMSQIDISHPKILTLEWIENPSDELLSTLDFQEVNWFDTSGLILDIHKKHDTDHRYYKGDFHGHTYLSDGAHTIDEAISVLENSSLDFMAFTDHNRLPFGFKDSHKLLIPSFELTMDQGHINLHGIMNADIFGPVHKEVLPKEDLLAYVTERHSQTANISINHMFLDTWQFTSKNYDIRLVNTIEIICDPTYPSCPDANDKAVDFLDFLWNEGHKIYGIGGSDSHNKTNDFYAGAMFPSIYGDPTTHVFCEGLSIDNVLKGIRNGHTYVSRFLDLDISIGHGSYLPGDQIVGLPPTEYSIGIENFSHPNIETSYDCRYILNGQVIQTDILSSDTPNTSLHDFSKYIRQLDYWWLRVGLYDMNGHLVAYVNPIYYGNYISTIYCVHELINAYNHNKEMNKHD